MSSVVQAKCPHCQNTLRIPADWVDKPMRCKNCQQTFQARQKAVAPVATATAASQSVSPGHPIPAQPLSTPRPSAGSFSFDEDDDVPVRPSGYKARKKSRIGLAIFFLLFLAGAGIGGYFLYQHLNPREEAGTGDNLSAKNGGNDSIESPAKKFNSPFNKKKQGVAPPMGTFPRSALLINVSNYLFFNTVDYGTGRETGYPGSSPGVLRDQFQRPPLNVPASQIVELSDAANKPHPVQKAVIETTIKEFLESRRAQDRVVLFFAGHGTEIDKDAYLIPIEGRKAEASTLIPMKWVYEQLAKCKARQKIFILDVNRFPPGRGYELPGAGGEDGEMGEVFDEMLLNPPPGVQVWTACVKGQKSIEFEKGSVFMQALCKTLQDGGGMTGISAPTDPIPVTALALKVNQRLKELLAGMKDMNQVSRLTGSEAETGAPFDPEEPLPAPIVLKEPPPPPEGAAGIATVNAILNELKLVPRVRSTRAGEDRLLDALNLPPFPAKVIAEFKSDDNKRILELRTEFEKNEAEFTKQFPVRAAVFEAVKAMDDSHKLTMRETLFGPINDKQKSAFLDEQKDPGKAIFKLENALETMQALAEMREMEKSKRWQAHFDYTLARLQARLVYIYEYSFILGQIRADSLPTLESGQNGWRVASSKKVQVNESKVKKLAKDTAKAWKNLQEEYADTPWAILAHRESLMGLGLEWRAKAD